MTDMCPTELERHLVLNSDRYDTYPKVKASTRDYIEQMRHRSDKSVPMDVGEMAYQVEDDPDGEWEEVQALPKGKGKGKGTGKDKNGKGANKGAGKGSQSKSWQEGPVYFPY